MKKHYYLLVWLYSTITILSIVFVVMDNLGIDFQYLKLNLWRFEKLFFFDTVIDCLSYPFVTFIMDIIRRY